MRLGLTLSMTPPPVFIAATSTPLAITSPHTSTTIITCVSATGQILPPFFIFKGKRYSENLMSGALPGSGCDMSPSGWSNGQIFKKYVKEFFQKHIPNRQPDEYCLLIYDGHKSHVNHDLIEWALENKIVLFVLPAHTSHITQPLDVSCFAPLKKMYNSCCKTFLAENKGRVITRYDVCQILSKAFLKAVTPSNAISGFRKTGIFPLNKNISLVSIAPSELLDQICDKSPNDEVAPASDTVSEHDSVSPATQASSSRSPSDQVAASHNSTDQICIPASSTSFFTKQKLPVFTPPFKKAKKRVTVSGMAITEPNIVSAFQEQRTCVTNTNISQVTAKGSGTHSYQEAGPSRPNMASNVQIDDSESDNDDQNDLCCISNRFSPPDLLKNSLRIVNWAQCDGKLADGSTCNHWVHTGICVPALRLKDRKADFLCPHCVKEQ